MRGTFSILDYVVFLGTLAVSMLIGVYYAFVKKQTTNADLLVGQWWIRRLVFTKYFIS